MEKYFKIFLCLFIIMSISGCKNYKTSEVNGKTIYTIEKTSYVETEEESDYVKIDVDGYGIIIAELYPSIAPITVKNFKKLVSEKFYDGLTFHRVIKNFMIQTGDPTGTGTSGSEKTIKGEFELNGVINDLSHTRGVLSMARVGAASDELETPETMNSASSQFFIVHKDSLHLDGKYAAFGKVVNGMDVVDDIAYSITDENDKPKKDKVIKTIRFVNLYEEEK